MHFTQWGMSTVPGLLNSIRGHNGAGIPAAHALHTGHTLTLTSELADCRLLVSPVVRADCSQGPPEGASPVAAHLAASAAAAAAHAGQSLFERLLAIMSALLSNTWASWLRGSQVCIGRLK